VGVLNRFVGVGVHKVLLFGGHEEAVHFLFIREADGAGRAKAGDGTELEAANSDGGAFSPMFSNCVGVCCCIIVVHVKV
jgi:hypothetical protein